MERAPKREQAGFDAEAVEEFEMVEDAEGWVQLREKAPEQAVALIESIDNFTAQSVPEQIASLQLLLEELSEDNSNRFLAEEVARALTAKNATMAYQKTMDRMNVTKDGSNLSIAA